VPPPRRRTSWLEDLPSRWKVEAEAHSAYPDLRFHRRQRPGGLVYTYDATVEVPGYEPRRVHVEFRPRRPESPQVFVDGPAGPDASPHRYTDRRLCIWYPGDDPSRVWVPDDGLLALFGMVTAHLFKEAYWRQTGEWLGDEAPHSAWEMDEDAGVGSQDGRTKR
jgi:hypothetical protein